MTPAGQRDRRIIFQRFTATQDEYGEEVQTWAQHGKPQKARIFYGLGSENREAAREQGVQPATFNCYATETTKGVMVRDRIVMGSENWDVVSIQPIGRREIDFTAKRAVS